MRCLASHRQIAFSLGVILWHGKSCMGSRTVAATPSRTISRLYALIRCNFDLGMNKDRCAGYWANVRMISTLLSCQRREFLAAGGCRPFVSVWRYACMCASVSVLCWGTLAN
jgi:hypothetical protein